MINNKKEEELILKNKLTTLLILISMMTIMFITLMTLNFMANDIKISYGTSKEFVEFIEVITPISHEEIVEWCSKQTNHNNVNIAYGIFLSIYCLLNYLLIKIILNKRPILWKFVDRCVIFILTILFLFLSITHLWVLFTFSCT